MAKAYSKSGSPVNTVQKTERYYTVSDSKHGKYFISTPSIRLKGQWLKAAGFDIGVKVAVKVIYGCLILIPDNYNKFVVHQQKQQHKKQLAEIKSGFTELFDVAQDTRK